MQTVMTPNGTRTIMDNRDAVEIVREFISDEMATYIENKVVEFDEVEWRNAQEWASDYNAMEMEVEEYRDALFEVSSQLQEISVKAEDKPGLSKKKVLEMIDEVWSQINRTL